MTRRFPFFSPIGRGLTQDVRFGLRLLARSPGFAGAAVLTLAVAIGANTAVFSVVNTLFLQPLPVAAPEALVRVYTGESRTSWPNYVDIRERTAAIGSARLDVGRSAPADPGRASRAPADSTAVDAAPADSASAPTPAATAPRAAARAIFTDVAAHRLLDAGLATRGTPERVRGALTSINYFGLLGVPAARGRVYSPLDTRRDLLVLPDEAWRRRFNADPAIVGRVLTINGRPYEVIGVMPPRFRGASPPGTRHEFWIPIDPTAPGRVLHDRSAPQVELIGRLAPGVTSAQARAAMTPIVQQLATEHPTLPDAFVKGMDVFPLSGLGLFRGSMETLTVVFVFLGLTTLIAGFVLLIGCANIAGLLLGRGAARRREIAVRLALGAGRWRLMRQLLTESLVLALLGGAAGVLLAHGLARAVDVLAARLPWPMHLDVQTDARVLAYALAVSAFTCLLFGLAPARRTARADVVSGLKVDGSTATARQGLHRVLVIGQVAVCSLLLVWSGLFVRSLGKIGAIDPGFDPADVLLAYIMLSEGHERQQATGERIFLALQQRLRDAPGVEATGYSFIVPLALTSNEEFYVSSEGDTAGTRRPRVVSSRLTPGWFQTVRIPILAGRDFTWDDRDGAPPVVIVNETLARQYWNGDAIGKRLHYWGKRAEVVGVVRDSKYWTIGETIRPMVYLPFRQTYIHHMTLHVRTANARGAMTMIRDEMRRLAPDVAVEIEPMTEAVAAAIVPAQIGAALTGAFGLVATLLSMTGVYALIAFAVAQRLREIGIRKAIGARSADILRLIVGGTVALTTVGLAIGLGLGALGGNLLRGFITGVSPADPLTLAIVAGLVMGAALLASVRPALRATRVDPMITFRDA